MDFESGCPNLQSDFQNSNPKPAKVAPVATHFFISTFLNISNSKLGNNKEIKFSCRTTPWPRRQQTSASPSQ